MSHSIVIADPSIVALAPAPIEPGWIVEGRPEARATELARSGDGTSVVVAWSCTAGRFRCQPAHDGFGTIAGGPFFRTAFTYSTDRMGGQAMPLSSQPTAINWPAAPDGK